MQKMLTVNGGKLIIYSDYFGNALHVWHIVVFICVSVNKTYN